MHLLKLLTAEFQANKKIFDLIHEFFLIISNEIWLKEGDLVEMSIEGLGQISNKITLEDSKYHIN